MKKGRRVFDFVACMALAGVVLVGCGNGTAFSGDDPEVLTKENLVPILKRELTVDGWITKRLQVNPAQYTGMLSQADMWNEYASRGLVSIHTSPAEPSLTESVPTKIQLTSKGMEYLALPGKDMSASEQVYVRECRLESVEVQRFGEDVLLGTGGVLVFFTFKVGERSPFYFEPVPVSEYVQKTQKPCAAKDFLQGDTCLVRVDGKWRVCKKG